MTKRGDRLFGVAEAANTKCVIKNILQNTLQNILQRYTIAAVKNPATCLLQIMPSQKVGRLFGEGRSSGVVRDDFCIKNRHKRYIACDDEARGQTVWGADAAGTKRVIKNILQNALQNILQRYAKLRR